MIEANIIDEINGRAIKRSIINNIIFQFVREG
jgi:hypothetical protein